MRLWSDEIEAMRPEAREVVAAGFAAMAEMLGPPAELPEDLTERAVLQRQRFEATYNPSDEAVERVIAGVPCRLFLPDGEPTAVYLHFHGGGMILGAPQMSDQTNLDYCRRFGLAVVSVDYRLAPEHPHPAGPDDGVAVADWLLRHAESDLGSGRLLIGGESAGGYMTAAVMLRIRDELDAADRVDGLNIVFGVHDWGRSPSQRGIRPSDGPDLLTPEGISMFTECYLPGRTDDERRDPGVSPAFADLRDLPPALMSVGTADHLVDDTLVLAARWVAAGNEVELFVAPDMPHGFMAYPCGITRAWADATTAWFDEILARPARHEQAVSRSRA